jgi:hypothetical protein
MQMGEAPKKGFSEWCWLNSSLGKVAVGLEQRLRMAIGATTAFGGINAIGVVSELKLVGGYGGLQCHFVVTTQEMGGSVLSVVGAEIWMR